MERWFSIKVPSVVLKLIFELKIQNANIFTELTVTFYWMLPSSQNVLKNVKRKDMTQLLFIILQTRVFGQRSEILKEMMN